MSKLRRPNRMSGVTRGALLSRQYIDGMLICTACKLASPRFHGHSRVCMPCVDAKRLIARVNDPRRVMISSDRVRAKRRGVPCTIKECDIIIPECCPILGVHLKTKVGSKGSAFNSPSLDAIVPSLGYVPSNVQVISTLANSMKSNATIDQLIRMGDWARERIDTLGLTLTESMVSTL